VWRVPDECQLECGGGLLTLNKLAHLVVDPNIFFPIAGCNYGHRTTFQIGYKSQQVSARWFALPGVFASGFSLGDLPFPPISDSSLRAMTCNVIPLRWGYAPDIELDEGLYDLSRDTPIIDLALP
jgi:hypothetical protein